MHVWFLIIQKSMLLTKMTSDYSEDCALLPITYSTSTHFFWQILSDQSDAVVPETEAAPDAGYLNLYLMINKAVVNF